MTLEHVTARLLAGSSYPFEKAIRNTSNTDPLVGHILAAARETIRTTHHGNTDWHIHRGIEAMGYIDWLYRKALQINEGPQDPT